MAPLCHSTWDRINGVSIGKRQAMSRNSSPARLMQTPINQVNIVDPMYSLDAVAERFRVEYQVQQ